MFKSLTLSLLFLSFWVVVQGQIKIIKETDTVGKYNAYELTIQHPLSYANNWDDVTVTAIFSGPQTIKVNGFFFDTNIWKVRFAPPETGTWHYAITFITPTNTYVDSGTFNCVPSNNKGFLKKQITNPFRLNYADGSLFNGIGLEDCIQDFNGDGTPLDDFGFDGQFRVDGYTGSFTNLTNYANAYGSNGAGFNLFRWTTDNCSFRLYNDITVSGNTYLVNEGKFGDTLVRSLSANKIRIWLTFFGGPVYNEIDGTEPLEDEAIEKYINYVVARYGAYVDIWELFNESSASAYYVNTISSYIRSIDPYNRLISISDQQPKSQAIDIISPHWYQKEPESESDEITYDMINNLKGYNKPIIFGEQGNSIQNWDVLSAERMRLRSWTSFFAEGMLIFWNTSFAKDYKATSANLYLGPQERGYIRSLQQFTSLADTTLTPVVLKMNNPAQVRGYGLSSLNLFLGYFHHYDTNSDSITTNFSLQLRRSGIITWINPADNKTISTAAISYGEQTITSPPFNIDLAVKIVFDNNDPVYNETEKLKVIIYPNPAKNNFFINGNFNGNASLVLYNITGKKMLSLTAVANNEPVDSSLLPVGIYIYKIRSSNRQATGRLIINK